jgi:hypothetical protein
VLGHVLLVGLCIVAGALTIWILGPTVGYFLGLRRIGVDIHAEPPIARPYPEDADGLRVYEQFVALGFRPLGWTCEHARFLTPIHWRWRSVQGARWLGSPDHRTFVCLYRVVADEPARFGAMTLLEGGGSWFTCFPGAGLGYAPIGNHGRAEVQGVGPAELLEKHAALVEAFRRERGLAIRPGSLADVANASLASTRSQLEKKGSGAFSLFPLGMFALPAAMFVRGFAPAPDRDAALLHGATCVIYASVIYSLCRLFLRVSQRRVARFAHTREYALEQAAAKVEGPIVPGAYERWVRVIAALGAADMIARLVLIAVKTRAILAYGPEAIFWAVVIAFVCGLTLRNLSWRAAGRALPKIGKAEATGPWFSWGFVAYFLNDISKKGHEPSRLVWLGGVVGLALLGSWLEKKGRK